jgi:sugar phosphate isomerase/epimerase
MPKISLSSWSFFLKMNYQRTMDFAVRNGFEGVEIWSNAFDFWPRTITSKEIETIRFIAKENQLSLAVHFCMDSNNLADLNAGHLNESMNQLKETIRLCRRIGGQLVIIHPGKYPHIVTHDEKFLNPKYTPAALKQAAIERFKESLREAAFFAASHDVIIGLENSSYIADCIHSTIEDLVDWVDDVNNPALQISLDIGHAHYEGGATKVIDILGDRIKHFHLYDTNGDGEDHKELGAGAIDWNSIAPFLKDFPGMLCLEVIVRQDLEGAVLRSKSFLEKLLARK